MKKKDFGKQSVQNHAKLAACKWQISLVSKISKH